MCAYEIEIEKLYGGSAPTRNLLLRVTDPALIALTGGIVQGMSGSPIVQDGKPAGRGDARPAGRPAERLWHSRGKYAFRLRHDGAKRGERLTDDLTAGDVILLLSLCKSPKSSNDVV